MRNAWLEPWTDPISILGAKIRAWLVAGCLAIHPRAWARSVRSVMRIKWLEAQEWVLVHLLRVVAIFHTRRDLDKLSHSMKLLAEQNVILVRLVSEQQLRLAAYEQGPLKDARAKYDRHLRAGIILPASSSSNGR